MNWWSWPGLNRRPRECHSRALPTALQPHTENDAITRLGSGQENQVQERPCPLVDKLWPETYDSRSKLWLTHWQGFFFALSF